MFAAFFFLGQSSQLGCGAQGARYHLSSFTGKTQAKINAVRKGGLPPLKPHNTQPHLDLELLANELSVVDLSGGKPPFLTCIYLRLSYVSKLERRYLARCTMKRFLSFSMSLDSVALLPSIQDTPLLRLVAHATILKT